MNRIIRPKEVAKLLGVSAATIYRWEASGRLAPRVILGPNTSGWREEDLAAFIDSAHKYNKESENGKGKKASDTSVAGRAGKVGRGSREGEPESGGMDEKGIGKSLKDGRSGRGEEDDTRVVEQTSHNFNLTGSDVARLAGISYQRLAAIKRRGRLAGLYVVLRNPYRVRYQEEAVNVVRTVPKNPVGRPKETDYPSGFPFSGNDLAKESGVDYQRIHRLKANGVLAGLWVVTDAGRIFFKKEAIQVVRDRTRGLPGRPPGRPKTSMTFTERARAAKTKAEERRKMLNGPHSRLENPVVKTPIPSTPDTPLRRLGCVSIGDRPFVLAVASESATVDEETTYYLFDESQTDMLGNRVARPVREGELKIADVVQLIGTLFTTLEMNFSVVDRAIMDSGKDNIRRISELLDVGTFIAPDDLSASVDERRPNE